MNAPDRSAGERGGVRSLFISSPQGHSGKTVVTIGLCQSLKRRGLSIQPFKKGPDYIDPSWLTVAAGRSCRTLDLFLIPREKLIQSYFQATEDADLAVIEGVMGLYDGLDSTGSGTSAEVARILKSPILLVVNASRMTDSVAAMVSGYQHFQPETHIAGVILNLVAGSRHEQKLRHSVEEYCGIPVVGAVPRDEDLSIAERHLGLIPSRESGEAERLVERIGCRLEPHLDVEGILKIARERSSPHPDPLPRGEREGRGSPLPFGERVGIKGSRGNRVKIGVVRDRAFNFYYPENLEALTQKGAELVFINSFKDRLPNVDGLYIGGGFPEFFLEEIEGNRELRQEIAKAAEEGLPVYAECAGLMYLCRRIRWKGRSYEMVGVIPAEVELSERPQGHGYTVAEVKKENPLFPVGVTLRGHEFHHSSLNHLGDVQFAYEIKRGQGISGKEDGIFYKNLFASYVHLHALGTPGWAEGLVSLALKEQKRIH